MNLHADFAADDWKLGGIDFVHVAGGSASTTALLAGQIDDAQLTNADSQAVSGNDQFELLQSFTEFSFFTLNFCSTQPPFDNELVRQAVQRGIDREAINRVWLQGAGQPAYGFWPQDHPNFASDLVADTEYDIDEAKRLNLALAVRSSETTDNTYVYCFAVKADGTVDWQSQNEIGTSTSIALAVDPTGRLLALCDRGLVHALPR